MSTFDHSRSKSSSSAKSSELTTNRFAPRRVPSPQAEPTPQAKPAEHTPIQPQVNRDEHGNPAWWSRLSFDPLPRSTVQPKLRVGQPNDQYEQEADRVAEQVMAMPDVQRQTASHPEEDEDTVQTKPLTELATPIQREAVPEDEEVQAKPIGGLVQREAEPEEEVQTKALNTLQREAEPEDEEIQTKPLAASITPLIQRDAIPEEEEVQTKINDTLQREEMPEEEEIQAKSLSNALQREDIPEEEEVQTKSLDRIQRQETPEEEEVQTKAIAPSLQREEMPEEEEPIQTKVISTLQREEMPEEEEPVQAKPAPEANLQREAEPEAEEPIQAKAISPSQFTHSQFTNSQFTNKHIQRKSSAPSPTANLESQLAAQKGGGSPLGNDVQSFMESRFGTDFSQVRVHTDASAIQMNKELRAQAFTHGSDIYFGAGKSPGQNELTAHELTHTIQQGGGVQAKPIALLQRKENKPQMKAGAGQSPVEAKTQPQGHSQTQPVPMGGAPAKTSGASPTTEAKPGEKPSNANVPSANKAAGAPSTPPSTGAGAAGTGGTGMPSGGGAKGATAQGATVPSGEKGVAAGAEKTGTGSKLESEKLAAGNAGTDGEHKAPISSAQDPAFQAVVSQVEGVGQQQSQHESAPAKSQEAQAAAKAPTNEVESKAQANQVGQMEQAETPPFDAAAFKAALMKKIAEAAPKNLEEADNFKKNNSLESVKGDLGGQVKNEQQATQKPLEEKTKQAPDTSGIEPKPVTPMSAPQPGKAPAAIGAEQAVPKPKGQGEVEAPIQADSQKLDHKMAEANVTDEQLAKSNEPQFQDTLKSKQTAQTHSAQVPQEYRQFEQGQLAQAKGEATATAQDKTQGMHADRAQLLGQVGGQQVETKGKDEQQRAKVAGDINKIYQDTKTKVEKALSDLDTQVGQTFDKGASEAKQVFEDFVDQKMKKYKDDRYGGVWGWTRWIRDKLFGMPSEVNAFYEEGRDLYLKKMDGVIDQVVAIVGKGLTQAKTEVANGKRQVQAYVAQLPENLKAIGQEAASDIEGKFGELEQSIDSKKDELIDTLAQKYQENLEAVDASIKEKKDANRGLIDKAIDAVVGVIKTIIEMTQLLLKVLARVASVIPQIIKDPIGFFNNLASGVKQGFQNFANNIVQHLKKGLIGWLTGALAGGGIQLPEKFDLEGIFSLLAQVLGLGYDMIRARLVKRLGEKKVSQMEQTVDIFKTLLAKGIGGIWQFVQEKIGDLKALFLDNIQSFIIESVIKAGILWLISLLNPASAFVRACKAIYDLVTFFIENAERIATFINTLLDSITAIAAGNVAQVVKNIESTLAQAIPLVIDLLAKLLGLGNISQKVHEIIRKLQKPIKAAIDWVIDKAVKAAKKIGGKLGFGSKKSDKEETAKEADDWQDVKKDFKAKDSESHTLFFEKKSNSAELMMASEKPITFKKFLDLAKNAPNIDKARKAYEDVEQLTKRRKLKRKRGEDARKAEMQKLMSLLSVEVLRMLPTTHIGEIPPSQVKISSPHAQKINSGETSKDGIKVIAKPLSMKPGNTVGSEPNESSPLFLAVNKRKGSSNKEQYVRGHLLNHNVHGPGSIENMTPINQALNGKMSREVEERIKDFILQRRMVISYEVNVEYNQHSPRNSIPEEQFLATKLTFKATQMHVKPNATGEKAEDWEEGAKLLDMSLPHELCEDI